MGREKRKGKEVVDEKPVRKRTRAEREREAERAEMVAKAVEEQASGRVRPFAIREQPARGRGRGRGMGRVRGARATRATTQQTEGDWSSDVCSSDLVEQPVHKRTRAEREAERAEMVAKAAEEQASQRDRKSVV